MPARVQTKSEVKATLDSLGIRPQRRFGQHFLIDGNLMRGLVRGAEIAAEDAVLEVGAGTGGLTDLLADSAAQVVSVEIDRALAEHLRRRFADRSKVRVLEGDALRNKNRLSDALTEAVRELSRQASGRCMLVANLPYNIATPLILNALAQAPSLRRFCFTVQRDVAEKMEARPGTKAYGPLGIILQSATNIRRISQVPASAFWPRPAVESSMMRLDVHERNLSGPEAVAAFSALVRQAFAHRRKTLRFNLRRSLRPESLDVLESEYDLDLRPEVLTIEDWLQLARRTVLAGGAAGPGATE